MANMNLRMARTSSRKTDKLTLILFIAFIVVGLITAVLAFLLVKDMVLGMTSFSLPGEPKISTSRPGTGNLTTAAVPKSTEYVTVLQPVAGPTAQSWDGSGRVTALFMGLDYRDWESGGIPRTDTMMLLTLDPISKTAGMLSIPRDMWVAIPGYDYNKINTAYFLGESYKLPGGGPGLAVKTVEHFIGVPINYYAQVDFLAFIRIVDEMIECVDINVKEDIVVDPIGPGNTQTLRPGVQCLPGDLLLGYARNRYTDGGDFDRARRQQEVIMATRKEILQFNMLPKIITKAPTLYKEIQSGIRTNMTLQQILQLAVLAAQIPTENIRQGVIGTGAVSFAKSPDGLDILIPVPDKIRLERDKVFTSGGPVGPVARTGVAGSDPLALVKEEKARISIQNGSGTPGLATRTSEFLKAQGFVIVEEINTNPSEVTTMVIYSGKPYAIKSLTDQFKIPTKRIKNSFNPDAKADIVIVLGRDWAQTNPMK